MDSATELVEAFVAAVPFALREMAGVEAVAREVCSATAANGSADVSAMIRLTAAGGDWHLILSFPQATATDLARRILTGTTDEVAADIVRDCMGEVANVVAGQAKALLVGTPSHFSLSTPTVCTDHQAEVRTERWVIEFDSEAGAFTAHLSPPRE